jgi:hypothetical protein
MNEREKAHAALNQALAAAEDRMGQKMGHLTKIGQTLGLENRYAYGAYTWAIAWVQHSGTLFYTDQAQIVAAVRKLAPVMLDLYLDKHGIE